jgi:putative restriction endonuclease
MKNNNATIREFRFFSKNLLREANTAAHREKRRGCIDPKKLESFPPDFIFYVTKYIYHKRNELRLFVLTSTEGHTELLDISIVRYQTLPVITLYENDTCDIKFNERPYPNLREWQESESIKPVRQQAKFRLGILNAYKNQCSVCEIKDKSLLRAAHIIDVKDGGTDDISNGICLCVNHEIAFDRGILKILPDYKVEHHGNIGNVTKTLRLPLDSTDHPGKLNLEFKLQKLNSIRLNKNPRRDRGCSNRKPLTIKPYPMKIQEKGSVF